jgi:O-acetylhomoserine/O-acetylserine sulfhydrylase-like pyridoxal-dependent enzyme
MNMKHTNLKLTGLWAGIVLTFASFGAYAGESHMAEALKHAEAAAKAADGKAIAEHAEAAKTHAKTADEHLDAGITSLDDAIDHGKLKHTDLAKKSAEEAVTHLKAAQ